MDEIIKEKVQEIISQQDIVNGSTLYFTIDKVYSDL